jgi:preprotein translocase subunit SecD
VCESSRLCRAMDELQEQMDEISSELREAWREDKVNYARIEYLENELTLLSYRYAMKGDRDAMKQKAIEEHPQVKQEKVVVFRRLRVAFGSLMA